MSNNQIDTTTGNDHFCRSCRTWEARVYRIETLVRPMKNDNVRIAVTYECMACGMLTTNETRVDVLLRMMEHYEKEKAEIDAFLKAREDALKGR